MSIKSIRKNNSQQFIDDIGAVREVMTYTSATREFFRVKKRDVLKAAESYKIQYYMTDEIFKVTRAVMVVV
jgi:hypothetical protein